MCAESVAGGGGGTAVFSSLPDCDTADKHGKMSLDTMLSYFSASHERHLIGACLIYDWIKYHKHPLPQGHGLRLRCGVQKHFSCCHRRASHLNYFSIIISCIAWLHPVVCLCLCESFFIRFARSHLCLWHKIYFSVCRSTALPCHALPIVLRALLTFQG